MVKKKATSAKNHEPNINQKSEEQFEKTCMYTLENYLLVGTFIIFEYTSKISKNVQYGH